MMIPFYWLGLKPYYLTSKFDTLTYIDEITSLHLQATKICGQENDHALDSRLPNFTKAQLGTDPSEQWDSV